MNKKVRTKVIECVVLIEKPKNRLLQFVFAANSIDTVILDLQEQYPNESITRKSILNWKFLTIYEYEQLQKKLKHPELFIKERDVQVSDTTEDAQ